MEISIHKKEELLSFNFIDKNNEYITVSKLYGRNFAYIEKENIIVIKIDLEKNLKDTFVDDMNDLLTYYKQLKSINLDNNHIIKKLISLIKFNKHSKYFLELSLEKKQIKKYKLSFSDNNVGISLDLNFITLNVPD